MTPKMFTVHCSDSKNGKRVDISEIKAWHLARGFKDIGYHVVIQPDGEIQNGRGLNVIGAHVADANDGNIGICLVGKDKFTKKQFEVLKDWMDGVRRSYQIPAWEVHGHYEFASAIKQGKTCPNMQMRNIIWYLATGDVKPLSAYTLEDNV